MDPRGRTCHPSPGPYSRGYSPDTSLTVQPSDITDTRPRLTTDIVDVRTEGAARRRPRTSLQPSDLTDGSALAHHRSFHAWTSRPRALGHHRRFRARTSRPRALGPHRRFHARTSRPPRARTSRPTRARTSPTVQVRALDQRPFAARSTGRPVAGSARGSRRDGCPRARPPWPRAVLQRDRSSATLTPLLSHGYITVVRARRARSCPSTAKGGRAGAGPGPARSRAPNPRRAPSPPPSRYSARTNGNRSDTPKPNSCRNRDSSKLSRATSVSIRSTCSADRLSIIWVSSARA